MRPSGPEHKQPRPNVQSLRCSPSRRLPGHSMLLRKLDILPSVHRKTWDLHTTERKQEAQKR